MTVIIGPVPPYSNPPIEPQNFQPSRFVISAIVTGATTLVTTSVNNNFVVNQQVRLLIPPKFGSRGLNESTGFVISISNPNQVVLDINSNNVDPFIPNPTFVMFESQTPAQIIAIGDENNGLISTTGRINPSTAIQGSFINVSA